MVTDSPPVEEENFISLYLSYTSKTECPTFFHQWTAITSLGAYLGRRIFFRHGHFTHYSNLYTMLIGSPGTKKSSAIKIGARLLKQAGYNTFAAKKTRQEMFLLDMAEQSDRAIRANGWEDIEGVDILDQNLWGDSVDVTENYANRPPAEVFVAADEFNNFIGLGNLDFMSILGELWDYEGVYDNKLKGSKHVFIPNPTVSILGGNTPTGFAEAFPEQAIGQGFFSRLLLVYGEPSGVKFTFPPPPDLEIQANLITLLHKIKKEVIGEALMTPEATELLHTIYHTWESLEDLRFEHYSNRRLTHLIKLCLIVTAARVDTKIEVRDVLYANTLLTFTEQRMPKALGEFGKARNSAVTHKIMTVIDNSTNAGKVTDFRELWKLVHTDLDSRLQLMDLLANLIAAEKIQDVEKGYISHRKVLKEAVKGTVDWGLLKVLETGESEK